MEKRFLLLFQFKTALWRHLERWAFTVITKLKGLTERGGRNQEPDGPSISASYFLYQEFSDEELYERVTCKSRWHWKIRRWKCKWWDLRLLMAVLGAAQGTWTFCWKGSPLLSDILWRLTSWPRDGNLHTLSCFVYFKPGISSLEATT